jgi:hypothetical protein
MLNIKKTPKSKEVLELLGLWQVQKSSGIETVIE